MTEIPRLVTSSRLWGRLAEAPDLQDAIRRLRSVVEVLAAKIGTLIPEFTDHSVNHLDSLWQIADQVLSEAEFQRIDVGEAFVLGCALYIHDLGMSIASTTAGEKTLREGDKYKAIYSRLLHQGVAENTATINALKLAAREEHAARAIPLITELVPGLDRYLIEDSAIRKAWADHIGQVAASHHWSLAEVERQLGVRGKVPDVRGGSNDLAYVACLLRIIDYAHINASRASSLERMLRSDLPAGSMQHWLAQEFVTGPMRESNQLVFGTTEPITDVDAWWTFYEMVGGLDREIVAVNEYLSGRAVSANRFSLDGVKGAKTPHAFAAFVQPRNFEPLDLRFHPDSMERLVEILGGRTLYGDDPFAPVRELLQNSRDAICLLQNELKQQGDVMEGRIAVSLEVGEDSTSLVVRDNGAGMSATVITNYLLGIASDYWRSAEFYAEHPLVSHTGFVPVGRFGIGFLSVFMIADSVEVTTQKRGGERLHLQLHGVGRRGSLTRESPALSNGTTVKLHLRADQIPHFSDLNKAVLSKAPMLEFPITMLNKGIETTLSPGWWKTLDQEEFISYLEEIPKSGRASNYRGFMHMARSAYFKDDGVRWPGRNPEEVTNTSRIIAHPKGGGVLICSNGFLISVLHVEGLLGMADIGSVELNAARSGALGIEGEELVKRWVMALNPSIINALDALEGEGDIPGRFSFLSEIGQLYGVDVLTLTKLRWIAVREFDGSTVQVPVSEFEERLRRSDELLLTYGASPWSCESIARRHFPKSSKSSLVIPISAAGQPSVGSYRDEGDVAEPLRRHFGSGYDSIDRAVLLLAVIGCVSRSWSVDREVLLNVESARRDRILSVHMKRTALGGRLS